MIVLTATTRHLTFRDEPLRGWVERVVLPDTTFHVIESDGRGLVRAYQQAYESVPRRPCGVPVHDIQAYIHDDVVIHETGWDARINREFRDPAVGLVGFGGALNHGAANLYRTPYQLQQLGRDGYRSNVDDAEVHGEREEGACDVAVLDGFCLAVRASILDGTHGWPVDDLAFHCYDYWLCAATRRAGYRIRMVGVRCYHQGGRSSVPADSPYQRWLRETGQTDVQVHEAGHRFIYEEFRDVLPFTVPPS